MTDENAARSIDLSVVIPTFNAARTIEAQLTALRSQVWDGSWEVVVADNGSTDETATVVARAAAADDRIRLVDASGRRGAAHARNAGVASARGPSIAFCDADDVVGTGWIAAVGDALREHEFVTGPQEHETLNESWLHGAYGTRGGIELQRFAGVFPFGPTANLGIRRELFDRLAGFDTSMHVGEDLVLCLRVWLAGVELQFVPAATVHYRYREDLAGLWRQATTYGAAAPDVARRLATAGHPVPARWRGTKNWFWLARKLPTLRSKSGRARWTVVAGGNVGRVLGSIRARYVML